MRPRIPDAIRNTSPMLAAAALFVAAGGYIHLREWLALYRHVPADAPGAAVVRLGFPINAAASFVLAAALAVLVVLRSRLSPYVVGGAFLLQLSSLAALIATRTGSLLGWTEPSWTSAANQTRAVEIGAIIALASIPILARLCAGRRSAKTSHGQTVTDAVPA